MAKRLHNSHYDQKLKYILFGCVKIIGADAKTTAYEVHSSNLDERVFLATN